MKNRLYKGKPVTIEQNACAMSACLTKCIVREQDRELWNVRIPETGEEHCEWFPLTVTDDKRVCI